MRFMVLLRWFVLIVGVGWLIALGLQFARGDELPDAVQQVIIALVLAGSGVYGLVTGDDRNDEEA